MHFLRSLKQQCRKKVKKKSKRSHQNMQEQLQKSSFVPTGIRPHAWLLGSLSECGSAGNSGRIGMWGRELLCTARRKKHRQRDWGNLCYAAFQVQVYRTMLFTKNQWQLQLSLFLMVMSWNKLWLTKIFFRHHWCPLLVSLSACNSPIFAS